MSDLAKAAAHYRRMADAHHKPDCLVRSGDYNRHDPACPGCVTPAERALWRALAREAERHLARAADTQEETLL